MNVNSVNEEKRIANSRYKAFKKLIPENKIIIQSTGLFLLGCIIIETIGLIQFMVAFNSNIGSLFKIEALFTWLIPYYIFSFPLLVILQGITSYPYMLLLTVQIIPIILFLTFCRMKRTEWSNKRLFLIYCCLFLLTITPIILPRATLAFLLPIAVNELSLLTANIVLTTEQLVQGYWGMLSWLTVWFFFSVNLLTRKDNQNDKYLLYFWLGWLAVQTIIAVLVPIYQISLVPS